MAVLGVLEQMLGAGRHQQEVEVPAVQQRQRGHQLLEWAARDARGCLSSNSRGDVVAHCISAQLHQ